MKKKNKDNRPSIIKKASSFLSIRNLKYEYIRRDEENNVEGITTAVDDVSFDVKAGEFIAVLGHNGSGKSTLAKHINAILFPEEGEVILDGMDTKDEEKLLDIRRTAGMVFQNPDNQIIGQVVDEDVAFGPENMGVPTSEIAQRVEESLKTLGMWEYRDASPNRLSGGQKQRVSIASVIAMHPKCIILDEPTAMLDPRGRYEVIRAARALNEVEGITIILITHYMEEVIHAHRVLVMDKGKVKMEGTPREIFSRVEELKSMRLTVPQVTELAWELKRAGLPLSDGILSREELVRELSAIKRKDD
ncbi:MAG: energy-coupling factor transporter ATPase [Lachnospiraceae bacterium]|nr:energy-coupling factor transporter ATPase [Lachnospiraceae bacterium]